MLFLGFCCGLLTIGHGVFESVALAGDGDEHRVVQEAVEDGRGGGHILEQFPPVLRRPVAGHDRRFVFIPAHRSLSEVQKRAFQVLAGR